ncbi:MAG: response regulator [Minwuia sp.]|nr:response regulator [Minwuia sp.]
MSGTAGEINLKNISVLVADSCEPAFRITRSILKSFGADPVVNAQDVAQASKIIQRGMVDLLIVNFDIDGKQGAKLVKAIRSDRRNPARHIPILMTLGHTSIGTVTKCRDAGSNMVLTLPLSPGGLYDRLSWIAMHPRPFVDQDDFAGPCRRFRNTGAPGGMERRSSEFEFNDDDEMDAAE